MILPQTMLKIRSDSSKSFIQFDISYVTLESSVCDLCVIRMSIVCTRMPFVCHSYVTRMYSYVILISLVCTHMLFVCHSYVFVNHLYSCAIGMSLVCTRMSSVCTRMSLVCTRMSPVCHSYVLVCHQYVTRMYSYVTRMSLVCGFTMNHLQQSQIKNGFNESVISLGFTNFFL